MPEYGALKTYDLSMSLALFNMLEAEGITSVIVARQRIQEEIDHRFITHRKMTQAQREESREMKRNWSDLEKMEKRGPSNACPSCDIGRLVRRYRDKVHYLACLRDSTGGCGYSETMDKVK